VQLYAHVVDDSVVYVGLTRSGLKTRLDQYSVENVWPLNSSQYYCKMKTQSELSARMKSLLAIPSGAQQASKAFLRRLMARAPKTTRLAVGRFLELATVIAGLWLAAVSWSSLNNIEGGKPVVNARNDGFLKASDYPRILPAQLAIRHDCGQFMLGDLFIRVRSEEDIPKYRSSTWLTLTRQAFGWPEIQRAPVDVEIKLSPSTSVPYPCKHIAIHVPGRVSDVYYEVRRTEQMSEDVPVKAIAPVPGWAHGASILISPESAPGFEGKLSFVWKDGIEV